MENKHVSKRGLSAWMEEFINGLAKKAEVDTKEEETKEEVVAEINVGDLDKIVWKDETFRVAFDEKGANVINEFGNTVTSIPDVKSVEEVDHKLNANEIVAAEEVKEDDLANELDKLALSLGEEDEILEGEDEDITASVEEEACDVPPVNETKEAAVGEEDEVLEGEEVMNVIASGFEELEATIATLEKRLSSIEQQYARVPQFVDDPGATQAIQDEVQHFTDSANQSAQELAKEKAVDITSPAGRVELSQHAPSEVQQAVTNDAPVATETPAVEAPAEEEPKPELEPKVEVPGEKDKDEDCCEDCGCENGECTCGEDKVEKLSGVAEKIFQQGICPETGEELVKSTTAGHFQGVYSPKGGTEYAVDLRSGEIFQHKK